MYVNIILFRYFNQNVKLNVMISLLICLVYLRTHDYRILAVE